MPIDDELRRRVDKHEQDLYQGNGKPSLTIRMALAERDIEGMNKAAAEIIKRMDQSAKETKDDKNKIKYLFIAAILGAIADFILRLVH